MSTSDQDPTDFATVSLDHAIGMGEAWLRLQRNGDFKKVIMNGYCRDKVLATHSLLAVPQIKDKGQRPDCFEDLIASSNLMFYFRVIEHEYEGAKNPILSDDEEKELEEAEEKEAAANLAAIGGVN